MFRRGDKLRSSGGRGIGAGIAIGVALGVALDNIGAGVAIGIAIGVGLEARQRRSEPGTGETGRDETDGKPPGITD